MCKRGPLAREIFTMRMSFKKTSEEGYAAWHIVEAERSILLKLCVAAVK